MMIKEFTKPNRILMVTLNGVAHTYVEVRGASTLPSAAESPDIWCVRPAVRFAGKAQEFGYTAGLPL